LRHEFVNRLVPHLQATVSVAYEARSNIAGEHIGDQNVESASVEISAAGNILLRRVLLW